MINGLMVSLHVHGINVSDSFSLFSLSSFLSLPPPPPHLLRLLLLSFPLSLTPPLSPPPLLSSLYPLGTDVTLVGYGAQIQVLRQALKEAENQLGISCELIDLRTILPWDVDTVVKVTVNNNC